MSTAAKNQPRHIMRLPAVMQATGFGRAHIYNLMAEGRFPKAVKIGPRAVGWNSEQVQTWIDARLDGRTQ